VNIKEYISTGVLESYVMGALTEAERAEVERNVSEYPELKMELEAIEEAQETLLMKSAIAPPAHTRNLVLSKAASGRDLRPSATVRHVGFWQLAAAASFTLAVLSSFLAYNYWKNWKENEGNLLALKDQNERIASDYNNVNQRLNSIEQDVRVMTSPEFKRILMKGTPNAPGSMAEVYWNDKTAEVFVNIHSMKSLARENQYQLWAFIDGKPVDAGVFDAGNAGLIRMKSISQGAVKFAVTIEQRGGKPTPSVETLQVIGDVPNS
jgi:anti-sigma-K factor RskA